ncbi:MAG: response regulator [Nitrospinae bacterium]|nr:response regulator [Nitrospinota bacterium]
MNPIKILVVDDEPLFRKMLRKFLVGEGFSVVEARDGDEAILAYKNQRADVVLLDVRMPGKDGLETLRELIAIDPEARVMMLTAVRDEDVIDQALAEGAADYVTKPINLKNLGATLQAVIASP